MHVEKYIQQTTLPAFPFIRRLNTAYIKSFFEGEAASILQQVLGCFSPEGSWTFLYSMAPELKSYSDERYRDAICYSLQKKDLLSMQKIADSEDLGEVCLRYGPALAYAPDLLVTDSGEPGTTPAALKTRYHTDEGYHTDERTLYFPVLVLLADYTDLSEDIKIATYDKMLEKLSFLSALFQLLRPARITLLHRYRPNYIVASGYSGVPGNCTFSSFPTNESLGENNYVRIQDTSADVTLLYKSSHKRIFSLFSTSKFFSFVIKWATNASSKDITVNVDLSSQTLSVGSVYCCRICLDTSATGPYTYDGVLYHS